MARSLSPTDMIREMPDLAKRWAQSLDKVVNGGLTFGLGAGKDATGQFNKFTQDNTDGVLIRVGASGGTQKYNWGAVNVAISINHGLQRQPIGAVLVSSDKALTIYQPTAPDSNTIHIAPTDQTSNATIYIF